MLTIRLDDKMDHLISLAQRIIMMKRKITWLLGLLICLVILCVLFFLLDKPRVKGFALLQDRPLVFSQSYQSLVWMGVEGKSDRYIQAISFLGRSFRNEDKIYCGYKNSIRVYDLNYQFLNEIDIHTLGVPEGMSFYGPITKGPGDMWWAAGKSLPDEEPFLHPHGIIHITMLEDTPKAFYYEIGEFAAAAVQDNGDSIFVFRNDQPYYEIYDTVSASIKSKIVVEEYRLDHIGGVFYHDVSKKIIVYGYSDIMSKAVIGYIKDQVFTLVDSAKHKLSGIIVGDILFYHRGSHLYQYDLNSGIRKLVSAPPTGSFYSSYDNSIVYSQENNFLCLTYSYRNLIGKLYMSSLFLNLKTKQYYLEKPMSPP
jgi:hypothetical protein